jgi:uncharacterized protein YndB with AHSA1/START domain
MSERGYLIIADITGYTRFLTGSELDHAQGILQDLFAVIVERLKTPLVLSNIQGDAFFAYCRSEAVISRGQIMDSLEALYFGFRDRLTSIVANTTCRCRACSNARKLDLKFIVHHGEYVVQEIAGRFELAGPDVVLAHRLLKNDVPARTGIASYALFTSAALDALDLPELRQSAQPYATEVEQFGRIEGAVTDFGGRWDEYHAASETVVDDGELWFEPVSELITAPVELTWEVFLNPDLQARWNPMIKSYARAEGDPAWVRTGAVDHCAHGHENMTLRFIDVRPLKHVTVDVALPFNGRARWTAHFLREDGATRLTMRAARPKGPNMALTLLLNALSMTKRSQVRASMAKDLQHLKEYLSKGAAATDATPSAGVSLSGDQLREAARKLASAGD